VTAATQARPKPQGRYRSGHCGIGRHEQCRAVYAGTDCGCPCHLPEPAGPSAEAPAPVRTTGAGALTGLPIEPLEPGSEPWLRVMSASKVAAMLGLSPCESRFSLWHRMAGLIPAEPESDVTARGHYLEPGICAWLADQHPDWQILPGGCWQHAEDARFTAAPDRRAHIDGETRGVEVKTAADGDEWGQPGTDEIPVGYRAQVMWQMDVLGTRVTHVAVLGAFLSFAEYVVHYDATEAAFLRDEAAAFLASLPNGAAPERPDIDSHGATYQAVRALHPDIEPVDVEITPEVAEPYCRARHALQSAESAEALARSLLADQLGNARRARYAGHTIATRQVRGGGTPYVVAGRHLPTFDLDQESTP